MKRSESVNVTNPDLDHITRLRIEELNQVVKQKNPFEQPLKEDSVKLQISNSSFNRSYLSPMKMSDQVNSSELHVLPQIKTVFVGDKGASGIVLNHLADGYHSNNNSKHQIGLQERAGRTLQSTALFQDQSVQGLSHHWREASDIKSSSFLMQSNRRYRPKPK